MSTEPAARRSELRNAAIKVGAAALIAAALYALYAREVKVEEQVQDLLLGARLAGGRAGGAKADLNSDTPAGLLAAEASLTRALELQPANPLAIASLADVEVQLALAGFSDRAERAEAAIRRADDKELEQPERFEAHALQLILLGRAGEAGQSAMTLLSRYGAVPRLVDTLGRAQRASGKLLDSRTSFKKAQDAEWRSPRYLADYAQALLEDGNNAEAAAAFDRALQANSAHLRSQLGKARALMALWREGRKGADLKLALSLCDGVAGSASPALPAPLRAQALATKAEVELALGETAAAADDAARASQTDAKSAPAQRARALVAAASPGQKGQALALFQAALLVDPYDASLYYDGAQALAAGGEVASAEKLLGSLAATLPKSARYHVALAQLLSRKGDDKAALAELQSAQSLEPANPLVYFEQGRVAQKQGDTKPAIAAYQRAAQLRDDFPEVYRQLGALYLESHDFEDAVRSFNEALARYQSLRVPAAQLETFYADVQQQFSRAGKSKLAVEWIKQARALR